MKYPLKDDVASKMWNPITNMKKNFIKTHLTTDLYFLIWPQLEDHLNAQFVVGILVPLDRIYYNEDSS